MSLDPQKENAVPSPITAESRSGASDLLRRDRKYVWHPFTQAESAPAPLLVVRAQGPWLELADGRRVLDGISSWWTNLHGHGHPDITEAIARQAAELDHVLFAGCTHPRAVEVSEKLARLAPGRLARVFFSDDGSTAVEVALKMAFQYWLNRGNNEKRGFVALEHAYHGDTVGAMSVGDPSDFSGPFAPLLFPVRRVPTASCSHCPVGLERRTCSIDCLTRLRELLEKDSSRIAALLLEPMVQAAGGMIITPPEFLRGVADLCREHDVLLIADEVMTGFGRTGKMFAVEHAGVEPDLMCVAKGLTGGVLPLAATLATEEIFEGFLHSDRRRAFLHGHSFTANPIACAAATASLGIFEREPVMERIASLEKVYAERLPDLGRHPRVKDVRWLGSLGVVELREDDPTYFNELGPRLHRDFLERGVLLRPLGPVMYTLPPYAIEPAQLSSILDLMEEMLG
ncbi:MAG: adenosylmethionine--8-amino-7-oxononanoate transaminase [Acidobacteria bacterium]|nr:adenosylmethionine--8-amino-7-oxononanoate transaminase [Acidobacteriota bacterium]